MEGYKHMRPPGASYPVGHTFTIRTGRRLLLYVGDRRYFQRENRRYYCVVRSVEHERYRDGWNRPWTRCVAQVEVIERP